MADIRFRQAAFLGVDQIIRFDQNLVVDAVNRAKRVVVRHQPDDALDRIGWDIGPFKKCPGQRRALLLLQIKRSELYHHLLYLSSERS